MIQIVMVFGYILLTALVSFYFAKRAKANTESFYTANRSMPIIVVAALLFSEIVAGAGTIGVAGNGFSGGLSSAVWANWGLGLGCFLIPFTVSKFYRSMAAKYHAMTIPECYAAMFGQKVRVVMIIVVALAYLIFFSLQAPAAASILAPMLGLDQTLVAWCITALFVLVTIFGGMVGVSWIGVVHTGVMIVGMGIVTVMSISKAGGMGSLRMELPANYFSVVGDDWMTVVASALGSAISFLASSNVTNALFGAKNRRSANGGMFIAGILTIPFALMPAMIGICAKATMPGISASNALYRMADSIGPVYSGLVSMAIIAAIWSTAPSLLMVISGTFTKDFYRVVIKPDATEKQQMRFSYVVIVIAGVLGTWLGLGAKSILNQMLGAFQIRSIVGIVLLAALVWPRVNSRSAFWSMLLGGLTAAVWFFAGSPFGAAPLWPGALVCLVVLVPLTLMSKQKISDGYQKYLDAQKELPENKIAAQPAEKELQENKIAAQPAEAV